MRWSFMIISSSWRKGHVNHHQTDKNMSVQEAVSGRVEGLEDNYLTACSQLQEESFFIVKVTKSELKWMETSEEGEA